MTSFLTLAIGYSFYPFLMSMSEALSPLYFKKTLLHKSSERSSLVSGPGLNSFLQSQEIRHLCMVQQQSLSSSDENSL